MKIRKSLAALGALAVLSTTVACAAEDTAATTSTTTSQSSSGSSSGTTDSGSTAAQADMGGRQGGGPGGVDPSSVSTEDELVALVQEAYGDPGLGLHRGHQPVEDVLDDVLQISHDELHVRMEEQGQNLAAVAGDVGVDPQTLIDALVESWSPAIDNLVTDGTITDEQADAYRAALEEAFTFRVTWDGEEATPTFAGVDA